MIELHHVLDALPGLVLVWEVANSRCIIARGDVDALLGYPSHEILGGGCEFIRSHSPAESYDNLRRVFTAMSVAPIGKPVTHVVEHLMRDAKGGERRLQSTLREVDTGRDGRRLIVSFTVDAPSPDARRATIVAPSQRDEADAHGRARGASRDAAERYLDLFQNIPLPAWVCNPETKRFLMVNRAALERYEYSLEEFLALPLLAVVAPDQRELAREALERRGAPVCVPGEWRHCTKHGEIFDAELMSLGIEFDGADAMLCVVRDVTAERLAAAANSTARATLEERVTARTQELQQALDELRSEVTRRRESERLLRVQKQVLETAERLANVGSWELDFATDSASWSEQMYHIAGLPPRRERLSREQARSIFLPSDAARLDVLRSRIMCGGGPAECEVGVRRPSGEVRHVVTHAELRVDEDNHPVAIVGAMQDVTEHRALERTLERRTHFLREIIDTMPTLVAVTDAGERCVIINRAFANLVGDSPEAIEASGVNPVMEVTARSEVLPSDGESPPRTGLVLREEIHRDASGQLRHLVWSERQVTVANEKYALHIGVDVTERQAFEARQREVEKMAALGQLAARIAHEINNPLAGLKGAFALIARSLPPDFSYQRYVGLVEREIRRMGEILKSMYALNRARGSGDKVAPLRSVVDEVCELLSGECERRGVQLHVGMAEECAPRHVPEALVHSVLASLVQNAIEASPPQAIVELTVTRTDEIVELRVADEGPGVPVELRERIFEPFFSTKSDLPMSGLGLGLAIARSNAEALGGTLAMEQRSTGGAVFVLRFPNPEA